jgi:hypothetical protein
MNVVELRLDLVRLMMDRDKQISIDEAVAKAMQFSLQLLDLNQQQADNTARKD